MKETIILKYQKGIQELFAKWKNTEGCVTYQHNNGAKSLHISHKNDIFITDGVVCPEQWFSQEVRPLFLFKEAYGGEKDWDLISDHLKQEYKISKMWKRVSEWTRGIMNTTTDGIAPYIKDEPKVLYYNNEYLNQIAVVNIRKSRGEKNSDMDVISAYANFDKENLRKQLELCDPTVIICGYTGEMLECILDTKVRAKRNDNFIYDISLNGHDVIVLDYWHPANYYPDLMNYYGLVNIYYQALKEKDG